MTPALSTYQTHIYKHARTHTHKYTHTTNTLRLDGLHTYMHTVGEGGGRLDGYLFCTTTCNAATSLQILYRAFQSTTEKLFTAVVGTYLHQPENAWTCWKKTY